MKVLVTGSTGMIGSALVPALAGKGHQVVRLVRKAGAFSEPTIHWDPVAGTIDAAGLAGIDAVVHLAGENIGSGRWTAAKKRRIMDSRKAGTRLLCEALAALPEPPGVLVSSSATGFYGDRGEERLTEASGPGTGFLAEVVQAWESATAPARDKGIRVVLLRTGVVLTTKGGALPKMLTPFRLGLGGPIGNGSQYWAWISLDDVVGVIMAALEGSTLRGPVNAVAPEAVTCKEFARVLGKVLRRPAFLPLPGFAAKIILGPMAEDALLASQRVDPAALLSAGYDFQHPDLESALRGALRR